MSKYRDVEVWATPKNDIIISLNDENGFVSDRIDKLQEQRVIDGDAMCLKTNEEKEDGAFAAWMVGGARRGHTRTPSAYREGYDAANDAFGLRLNHGVARACRNLEGDAVEDHRATAACRA